MLPTGFVPITGQPASTGVACAGNIEGMPLRSIFQSDLPAQHASSTTENRSATFAAHSPIRRMPSEVILAIFHELRASYRIGSYAWITVARVCQGWRHISLSHSSLWTDIDSTRLPKEWLPTVLERSGSSQLCVDVGSSWFPQPASSILAHANRIKTLRIKCWPNSVMDTALSEITRTPVLEELRLDCRGTPFVPALPFAGHAPRLRRLSVLAACRVSRDWPFMRHITSLFLRPWGSPYSLESLEQVFQNIPLLEKLELGAAVSPVGSLAQPVMLPSLSTLNLVDSPAACTLFFTWFQVPRACSVALRPYATHSGAFSVHELAKIPKLISANHAPYTYAALRVIEPLESPYQDRIVELSAWPSSPQSREAGHSGGVQIVFFDRESGTTNTEADAEDGASIAMFSIFKFFAVAHIKELVMELDDFASDCIDVPAWADALRPIERLQVLRISAPRLGRAFDALDGWPAGRPPLFPDLSTLELLKLPSNNAPEDAEPSHPAWVRMLACILRRNDAQWSMKPLQVLTVGGELGLHMDKGGWAWGWLTGLILSVNVVDPC